jgi:hypothetical protein
MQLVYGVVLEGEKQRLKLSLRNMRRTHAKFSQAAGMYIIGDIPIHRSWSVFERDDLKTVSAHCLQRCLSLQLKKGTTCH